MNGNVYKRTYVYASRHLPKRSKLCATYIHKYIHTYVQTKWILLFWPLNRKICNYNSSFRSALNSKTNVRTNNWTTMKWTTTAIKAFYTFSHCQMLSRHFNVAYFMAAEPVTIHFTRYTFTRTYTLAHNYICALGILWGCEAQRQSNSCSTCRRAISKVFVSATATATAQNTITRHTQRFSAHKYVTPTTAMSVAHKWQTATKCRTLPLNGGLVKTNVTGQNL